MLDVVSNSLGFSYFYLHVLDAGVKIQADFGTRIRATDNRYMHSLPLDMASGDVI